MNPAQFHHQTLPCSYRKSTIFNNNNKCALSKNRLKAGKYVHNCSKNEAPRIIQHKTVSKNPNRPVVCNQCQKAQWSMNLSNHYRHAHPEIKIGKKDQTVIDEAEAWKGEATKQLKKLNAIKQRNKRLRGKTTTGPAA